MAVREIHLASECALQGLLRPIGTRGEANLVSPRGFEKVNQLIISTLAKINSRGEFHEAPGLTAFGLFPILIIMNPSPGLAALRAPFPFPLAAGALAKQMAATVARSHAAWVGRYFV